MEEYSYTCTHPLGPTGPVTGSLYLYLYYDLKLLSAVKCELRMNEFNYNAVWAYGMKTENNRRRQSVNKI